MRVALVVPVCPKRRILQGLSDWQHAPSDEYTRAVLYLFLFILHRRDAKDHQDLLRILVEEHTHNRGIVDMAESIIQLSEQRGHQQGKAEGIVEGKRDTILQFLRLQFQDVPDPITQRITAIDNVSDLDALLEKCLKAKSLEDIL